MSEDIQTAAAEEVATPVFSIEKLYVKDISLEIPHAPAIFLDQGEQHIDLKLHNNVDKIEEGYFSVSLTVTVTSKIGDKTVYLAEVAQAGVFQIRNIPEDDIGGIIGIGCPTILFPYAREVISDLTSRGGFQPVVLAPVNFEALFQQRVEELMNTEAQGNA